MDPLSITTACINTLGAITKLSLQINGFVSSVREARRDMDAVSRELVSLSSCLAALRDDSQKINFPETLREVVASCEKIAEEMTGNLDRLSNRKSAAVRWTIGDREQMDKLRSSLESHKSCIDIALEMVSIQILSNIGDNLEDVKNETVAIREDTSEIKQDTKQIASLIQEIGFLRLQVANFKQEKDNIVLRRFLDESTSYAESSVDPEELEAMQTKQRISLNAINQLDTDDSASANKNSTAIRATATDGARGHQEDLADDGGGQATESPRPAPVRTRRTLLPTIRSALSPNKSSVSVKKSSDPFRDPLPSIADSKPLSPTPGRLHPNLGTTDRSAPLPPGGNDKTNMGGPLYGIMQRDFETQSEDGPGYREGEAVFVEARGKNSVLVKPLGRVGKVAVVPLEYIEIKDGKTGQAVADPLEAIRIAGLPSTEEWDKMMSMVHKSLVPLYKLNG